MDKYRKLAGNTVTFAIGSFGSKLLSFFLVRLHTTYMSLADFGKADLIYQTVNVLYPIVTFAMADAIIRFGIDRAYDKRKVYSIAVFSTVAGMALLCLASPVFNSVEEFKGYGFLLFVYCYCSGFRQLAASFVRARGYVRLFALDGILSTFTVVICNFIFLAGFGMGVTGYILSIIISDALSFIGLTFIASLNKYLDPKYIDKALMREMLKYSVPLISTYVLWWVTAASDRWFIRYMVGENDNGIYAAAYKIPNLLLILTTLFFQAWQMSAIENKDSKTLGKFFGRIFSAYSSVLFIAAAGIILIVKPFTSILLDPKFLSAYMFTPVIVIAVIFQCLCQFLSSVYNVKKKSVNSLLTAFAAAAVNIVLNLLLIPSYGSMGAAAATVMAYASCYAIRIFDARKHLYFKVAHGRVMINLIVVIYMANIAVLEPRLAYVQLTVMFILMVMFNFEAVISTLKKIVGR
ncbi:MAG: polysaccharide biosynthesis C-terminal domain-containing protein [Oscillospiraceae bacterium]|nr:polysaccharide biosynthesis C-terminal domain-containing protein [Oscillospiraceae bacterium]